MINVNLASKVRKGTLHWCVYIATPSSKLSKLPRDKNGGGECPAPPQTPVGASRKYRSVEY